MYILRETWPDLNVIHEKSQYSHSHSNIEHATQYVENKMIAWKQANKTSKWSEGFRYSSL